MLALLQRHGLSAPNERVAPERKWAPSGVSRMQSFSRLTEEYQLGTADYTPTPVARLWTREVNAVEEPPR